MTMMKRRLQCGQKLVQPAHAQPLMQYATFLHLPLAPEPVLCLQCANRQLWRTGPQLHRMIAVDLLVFPGAGLHAPTLGAAPPPAPTLCGRDGTVDPQWRGLAVLLYYLHGRRQQMADNKPIGACSPVHLCPTLVGGAV